MIEINTILPGDALKRLKGLPDKSVHCIVTSPPYYALRDYGVKGQIGLEQTPEQFISKLVEVFREARRVLRDDGTLWLNTGDSYAGSGKGNNPDGTTHPSKFKAKQGTSMGTVIGINKPNKAKDIGLKNKDLIGIPWMLAFALRADGWYLRQDIIWNKPNPMPESVTDRCTKSHEYIFLLSKSPKYYFDVTAIRTPLAPSSVERLGQDIDSRKGSDRVPGKTNGPMKAVGPRFGGNKYGDDQREESRTKSGNIWEGSTGANKRSVWTVATTPYKEAHFATFPEALIIDCIKAGSGEGGIILDPFGGAGTTAVVALKLKRNYVLIELNPDYIQIAEKRIAAVRKEIALATDPLARVQHTRETTGQTDLFELITKTA